ncbi:unnamed protein product [Peniophora sp. CBMAI 1063]|nr:unnamed protein product [Peniophora sp. CBMAI 1063]
MNTTSSPNISWNDAMPSITTHSTDRGPAPEMHNVLGSLWLQALRDYQVKTGVDPMKDPLISELAGLNSTDEIMNLFDAKMRLFREFRANDSKWCSFRNTYLKPAVHSVILLTDALSELASYFSVVPGGKAIFVAFGTLLKATEGVSKRYDALQELFEQIPFFLESAIERNSTARSWGAPTRGVAVAILVHLLDVFALAVRRMNDKWRRLKDYSKSLIGTTDMESALSRLKELTRLETRAIASETRVVAATILAETERLVSTSQEHNMLFREFIKKAESSQHEATEAYSQAHAARVRSEQELGQIRQSLAESAANARLGRLERLDLADLAAQDRTGCLSGTRVGVLATLSAWSHDPNAPRIYWLNAPGRTTSRGQFLLLT